ncbi:hypothetical protein ACLOJK_026053 [Asimina triloba]
MGSLIVGGAVSEIVVKEGVAIGLEVSEERVFSVKPDKFQNVDVGNEGEDRHQASRPEADSKFVDVAEVRSDGLKATSGKAVDLVARTKALTTEESICNGENQQW